MRSEGQLAARTREQQWEGCSARRREPGPWVMARLAGSCPALPNSYLPEMVVMVKKQSTLSQRTARVKESGAGTLLHERCPRNWLLGSSLAQKVSSEEL